MENKAMDRIENILSLYQEGWAMASIASRLGIGVGEVREVINVNSARYRNGLRPLLKRLHRMQPPEYLCCHKTCPWRPAPGRKCVLPNCFMEAIK